MLKPPTVDVPTIREVRKAIGDGPLFSAESWDMASLTELMKLADHLRSTERLSDDENETNCMRVGIEIGMRIMQARTQCLQQELERAEHEINLLLGNGPKA